MQRSPIRIRHSLLAWCLGGACALAALAPPAHASEVGQTKRFGLGLILGQPTGISVKYYFTPKHALTGGVGVGWWAGQNFHVHVDYGYHFSLARTADFDLALWVGGGVKFFIYYYNYHPYWDPHWQDHDYGRFGLGLRVPVGLGFHLNRVPLDIFLEIAPGIAFLPWIDGFADGGVGVRYYF
jgi:hypothetical protein